MALVIRCTKTYKEEIVQYLTKPVNETRKDYFHTDEVAIHHIILLS